MNYIYHFHNEAFGINEFSHPIPKETKWLREKCTVFSKGKYWADANSSQFKVKENFKHWKKREQNSIINPHVYHLASRESIYSKPTANQSTYMGYVYSYIPCEDAI